MMAGVIGNDSDQAIIGMSKHGEFYKESRIKYLDEI